jgi:acyl-coenzyme A thioesterase PaaI-like protein
LRAVDYEALRAGMSQMVPFNNHIGLEVVEIGDGTATVRLPEGDHMNNHVGSQHAGGLFSAAEAASGAAMLGAFAEIMGNVTPLARSAQIEYLKLAKGPIDANASLGEPKEDISARLEAEGRVQFPVNIELVDGEGLKVAEMTVDWHVRRNDAG